jgi:hypothetical protein
MGVEPQESLLLQLPDACLLAVLQCLSDDATSLCRAARAHSRLHQAAVLALSNIHKVITTRQQVDGSLLPYLRKHGQRCGSITLMEYNADGDTVSLRQLVPSFHLTSLHLERLNVQLWPGNGFEGVLGPAGLPLKQLHLEHCTLLDGAEGFAAVLPQLPGLEHLTVHQSFFRNMYTTSIGVLQQLQQLTHLELAGVGLQCTADQAQSITRLLQALPRLVHLRLSSRLVLPPEHQLLDNHALQDDTSAWSGSHQLTYLWLPAGDFDPNILAGMSRLRHLQQSVCKLLGGAGAASDLLSQLANLQQLTYLNLGGSLLGPSGAAFSGLTASSMLQHLQINHCTLPAGVWQHMFPVGMQLLGLRVLDISFTRDLSGGYAAAPNGRLLVNCCPGLQELKMRHLHMDAEQLAPLTKLSDLHTLCVTVPDATRQDFMYSVCQLTGLRGLGLDASPDVEAEGLLLQLTQLRQLEYLYLPCLKPNMHAVSQTIPMSLCPLAIVVQHCSSKMITM